MDPFVGEIQIFAGNFAPRGWAFCNGQLLPISQNTALFSLLGTNYGGDGRSTFALPNLQGVVPIQWGQGAGLSDYVIGETGGQDTVTLLTSEIPSHTHQLKGTTDTGNTNSPSGNVLGENAGGVNNYSDSTNSSMNALTANTAGSSLPHNNMQPYLTLNYIIALQGVFPPRP